MNDAARPTADTTRRRWWAEAEALGGTSTLLDHPDGPDAGLDLTTAHPSGLAQLLAGGPAPLSSLVRESGAFADARRRARTTHRRAAVLLAQRGTRALAVAVGTVTWVPPHGPARRTPLLLRRCSLTPVDGTQDDFVVQLDAGVLVNPVLVRTARAELGVELDAPRVARAVGSHRGFDPDPALEEVRRQLSGAPGLRVERRLLLSTFTDPGSDLLAHLRDHGADVRGHRVVRALAEQVPVAPAGALPAGGDAPVADRTGLALDPWQHRAVEHVLAGGDLRLEASAGTGATQVAAAIVAAGAAAGRTTLLVADSAAERRAVDERLREHGLGRLVLHVTAELDAAAVLAAVREQTRAASAEAAARGGGADPGSPRPEAAGAAAVLDEHARALHRPREPWGVSAHDAMEALAALAERDVPATTTRRLRGRALAECRREDLPVWAARLRRAVELGAFEVSGASTPWADAPLRSPRAAEDALARVRSALERTLPAARALMATVCDAAGLRGAASVAEANARVELLEGVRASVDRFGADVFTVPLGDPAAATATAQWRRENGVRMGALARWRLRRRARALLLPSAAPESTAELHDWLQRARAQRLAWQRVAVRETAPHVPDGLDELCTAVAALRADLLDLERVLPGRLLGDVSADRVEDGSLLAVPLPELTALLRSLAADAAALDDLPERTVLLDELAAAGWQPLLEDLGARWGGAGSLDLTAEVERAWWAGVLDAVCLEDHLVGAPDAPALRSARAGLQLAEAAARTHDARRVRRAVDARVPVAPAAPVRAALPALRGPGRPAEPLGPELTAAAALLPCTALSAAGAAALAADLPQADLVVVLGARSTATSWALPALARGRRLVVVGDPALPGPRDLADLADLTGRDGTGEAAPPPRSLLDDAAGVLPGLRLERQHACLDDRLLEGVVPVTGDDAQDVLPGSGPDPRAVHRTSARTGARRGPDALVELTLGVVADALHRCPGESLGVLVPDAAGADLLGDVLRRRLAERGLGHAAGELLVAEPPRWAGERRDHVVVLADPVTGGAGLGAGHAPPQEVVLALTRSRLRTTLVLDDARWEAAGHGEPGGSAVDGRPLLLRTAVAWESPAPHGERTTSALQRRLAAACRDLGLPVTLGAGRSGAVPIAVRRPDGTGPALAVELDGPGWAAVGVLEREVVAPARLERRGWWCVRSLEADVLADPAAEAHRLARRWREAVAELGEPADLVLDLRADAPVGPPPRDPRVSGRDERHRAGQDAGQDAVQDLEGDVEREAPDRPGEPGEPRPVVRSRPVPVPREEAS
ncbi:hypothetical protein MO973_37160 [Paenibacillus sp. TRM 82003]|uniref:hypothetical protein n=1 Tax=Kineococcus sp. TRM81007 TaxID=2925831 RepID=UPI001F5A81F0|nr:hypothetical protein [Kineococcus sp. TRM81007]MCI2239856.1 hypothetical protein [Kineococcus sp. TRM81007]MCI3925840.1 hypothetical protein [Paenibacillus sp. TRM 82003]